MKTHAWTLRHRHQDTLCESQGLQRSLMYPAIIAHVRHLSGHCPTAIEHDDRCLGRVIEPDWRHLGHRVYAIADLPDNVSAAATALTVSAGGGATVRTVVLLTVRNRRGRCQGYDMPPTEI